MRVLVTGATGFVGSRLVPELVAAGHDVVVLVRDRSRYNGPADAEVVVGDLLDYESLPPAFEGVEAAYYLVHSMHSGSDFEERDRRAARNFVDAASGSSVERVIYLGGLGEERDHLSKHLRSRREVEHVLESGSYALTTLRAAIIVGAGSASFDMIRQLVSRLPVMITPRWVRTPCQPIAIDDVVAFLVGVLESEETAGRTFEIGGPDILTYQEMLERTARVMGRRLRVVPVPVLSPELSAYWVNFVTDVPKSVARPLITGLRNPVVCSENRIHEFVDVDLTPFDAAVEQALTEDAASRDRAAPEAN
ncbi:NAD(P)H-binding protein [Haloarchaeobius sp. DYHT-AS-18]|uniref:NAD(P)H-binding protein n=1 Tax=Haloarchaeobius sp. DYHT-AS-18 TaxID=3446117 RepID=UPI003EBC20A1